MLLQLQCRLTISLQIQSVLRVLSVHRVRVLWNSSLFCLCRLLLSIDRRQSIEEAYETLRLAQEYSNATLPQGKVVGLDLSGDPKVSGEPIILTHAVDGRYPVWALKFVLLFSSLLDIKRGDMKQLLPVLIEAKNSSLKLAVHLAEVQCY